MKEEEKKEKEQKEREEDAEENAEKAVKKEDAEEDVKEEDAEEEEKEEKKKDGPSNEWLLQFYKQSSEVERFLFEKGGLPASFVGYEQKPAQLRFSLETNPNISTTCSVYKKRESVFYTTE